MRNGDICAKRNHFYTADWHIQMGSSPLEAKKEAIQRMTSFVVDDNGLEPLTLRTSSACSTS